MKGVLPHSSPELRLLLFTRPGWYLEPPGRTHAVPIPGARYRPPPSRVYPSSSPLRLRSNHRSRRFLRYFPLASWGRQVHRIQEDAIGI